MAMFEVMIKKIMTNTVKDIYIYIYREDISYENGYLI
jgi:hypothetical protein